MGTDTAPTATAWARWFECHMVMDEATSHLDVATETRVSRHIAALGMTRIIVAHGRRPSHRLIAWCIEQGALVPCKVPRLLRRRRSGSSASAKG